MKLKRFVKRNSHNAFFKVLAGFGRALNRHYENRNHDIYSNGELTVIKKIAKLEPTIIIDGGANIGKYSTILTEYCKKANIYSFEPVSNTYKILESNLKGLKNVHLEMKGLFSENIFKEINLFPSSTHSSIFEIEGLKHRIRDTTKIELIKGDDFLKENNINQLDFIKLDLEGSEYEALLGFKEIISKQNVRMIQFEFGYINITTKKLLVDFYNFFNDFGYVLGKVFPKTVEFREYNFIYEDFLGPNFVAVRKDDEELIRLLTNK